MSYLSKSADKRKKKAAAALDNTSVKGADTLYKGKSLPSSAVKVTNKSMFGRRSGSR